MRGVRSAARAGCNLDKPSRGATMSRLRRRCPEVGAATPRGSGLGRSASVRGRLWPLGNRQEKPSPGLSRLFSRVSPPDLRREPSNGPARTAAGASADRVRVLQCSADRYSLRRQILLGPMSLSRLPRCSTCRTAPALPASSVRRVEAQDPPRSIARTSPTGPRWRSLSGLTTELIAMTRSSAISSERALMTPPSGARTTRPGWPLI